MANMFRRMALRSYPDLTRSIMPYISRVQDLFTCEMGIGFGQWRQIGLSIMSKQIESAALTTLPLRVRLTILNMVSILTHTIQADVALLSEFGNVEMENPIS